jgi:hypothetical protein
MSEPETTPIQHLSDVRIKSMASMDDATETERHHIDTCKKCGDRFDEYLLENLHEALLSLESPAQTEVELAPATVSGPPRRHIN